MTTNNTNENRVQFWQSTLHLKPFSRGFHLITEEIQQATRTMPKITIGVVNIPKVLKM